MFCPRSHSCYGYTKCHNLLERRVLPRTLPVNTTNLVISKVLPQDSIDIIKYHTYISFQKLSCGIASQVLKVAFPDGVHHRRCKSAPHQQELLDHAELMYISDDKELRAMGAIFPSTKVGFSITPNEVKLILS